jgi:nitrogen fixation NifU-like protein
MRSEKDVFDELEGIILEEAAKTYSPQVIEHFREPKNYGALENPDAYTFMSGMCGDTIGIFIGIEADKICRVGFVTDGCGPTIACASALTCMTDGLSVEEAARITGRELIEYLGGLPVEHTHCADLAVNTLRGALEKVLGKA